MHAKENHDLFLKGTDVGGVVTSVMYQDGVRRVLPHHV